MASSQADSFIYFIIMPFFTFLSKIHVPFTLDNPQNTGKSNLRSTTVFLL